MNLKSSILTFKTDKPITCDANRIRRYIGYRHKEHPLLFNQYGDRSKFTYPLIQYKIIDGELRILGLEEGSDIVHDIADKFEELTLDQTYHVEGTSIEDKDVEVGPCIGERHYTFITPWIALNANNQMRYNQVQGWAKKTEFLNKILIGNILSMSKGLGFLVEKRIVVKSDLRYTKTTFDSKIVNAFLGNFTVHFEIPDYFGLGKGVTQGHGCIKQIEKY